MIALSIILCIFANFVRYADNTSVKSFKDYINYSNKIVIIYNVVWVLITFCAYLITILIPNA